MTYEADTVFTLTEKFPITAKATEWKATVLFEMDIDADEDAKPALSAHVTGFLIHIPGEDKPTEVTDDSPLWAMLEAAHVADEEWMLDHVPYEDKYA